MGGAATIDWQKYLCVMAQLCLLAVLLVTSAFVRAENASDTASVQDVQLNLEKQAVYVTEALRGLKYSLPKYSQLSCQPKNLHASSAGAAAQSSDAVHCAMTVLPAPQLRAMLYKARPGERFSRYGEALQYMVEISDTAASRGSEPLQVMIEEPPQVRFGELPPICEREQSTIICLLDQAMRSGDGKFRIRLPVQIEQEPPAGHLLSVSIPAWLLVDNCGAGECRPDDRRPLASALTELYVAGEPSQSWLYAGLLLGAGLFLCVLLVCHAHNVRRLGAAWLAHIRRRRRHP